MKMYYFLVNSVYVMEVVAAVTAFIYINKWKETHWKWFPFYLAFIAIADIFGTVYHDRNVFISLYLYNCVIIPTEFFFFFWIFQKALRDSVYRSMPKIFTVIYAVFLLVELLYLRKVQFAYMSLAYTVGNVLLLVLILMNFLQLMNSDSVLKYKENILFWVSVGLLIFYLGSFPFYAVYNVLVSRHHAAFFYYKEFESILNSIMYFTFALSFICGKPKLSNS